MRMCKICNKYPAVVFVSKMEGAKSINEGYCLSCAIKSGITPVNQLAEQFAMDPEELKGMVDGLGDMLEDGSVNDMLSEFFGGGNLMEPPSAEGEERIPIQDKEVRKGIKNQQKKKKCLSLR